jgi:hypothetical protein
MVKLAELASTYVLFLSPQKGSSAMYASGKGEMYTMYARLQSIHFSAGGPLHPIIYSMGITSRSPEYSILIRFVSD